MASFDSRDWLDELPVQGCTISICVSHELLDFNIQIADSASWRIPELDVGQESFCHRGFQGSLCSFMERVQREVLEAKERYPVAVHPRFDAFLNRITSVLTGEAADFQLEVKDPSGLSKASESLAPRVELFERTVQQERKLGVQYPQPNPQLQSAADVARLVHAAQRIVFLTGAGVSVESGITPFRNPKEGDNGAVWGEFDARRLTVTSFNGDPEITAQWWIMKHKLLKELAAAVPNPAHDFCGWVEQQGKLKSVITQNIDSLHGKGGVPQSKINELHGHMRRLVCSNHRSPLNPIPYIDGACDFSCEIDDLNATSGVPACPCCGCPLRTETVMFEQPMPDGAIERARGAVAGADLFVVIGTTLLVQPANELPAEAFRRGIPTVMVNFDETLYDANFSCLVRQPAGLFFAEVRRILEEEPALLQEVYVAKGQATEAVTDGDCSSRLPAFASDSDDDEQLFGDDDIGW